MKVFELAKELNVTPKELITFFKDNEYKVSSHMQKLDDELIDFARSNFVKNNSSEEDVPEEDKKVEVEKAKLELKKAKESQIENITNEIQTA